MTDHDFSRNSVLLVTDDLELTDEIRNILTFAGVGLIRAAANLSHALREMARMDPDLIITDRHMVPVNGIEFTRIIRQEEHTTDAAVPIILVSSAPSLKIVFDARDAGVNEILVKPISANALLAHIALTFALPRPFVKAPNFVGPDRRRRQRPIPFADRRLLAMQDDPSAGGAQAWRMA